MPISQALISVILVFISTASIFAQAKPIIELDLARCWTFSLESAVKQIAADDTRAYVGDDAARITAFLHEGRKAWSSDLGGEIVSNIVPWESGVFVVTASGGDDSRSVLRVMSRETGIVGAAYSLPDSESHVLAIFKNSLLIVSGSGIVQSLDGKGVTKWRREIAAGFAGRPAFDAEKLHVASTAKQVFTIDLATGEIASMRKVPNDITALGVTTDGILAVGDVRGALAAVGPDGRENWRFRTGARVSHIFTANGHLFAISLDNFVYCLDVSNGNVIWKRRLDGRATHALVVQGAYVFSTSLDEHGAALTSVVTGKPAGQMIFGRDEWVTAAPAGADSLLVVGTNTAVAAYSLVGSAGCPK